MSVATAASAIPNIFGGFAPFPNTIATALLAYQSEAIGYGFGIKFQYAKRKIGAMTNEEFNALTDFTLGQIVEAHTTELTNRMISEMPRWIEIQDHYIEAGVTVEVMKANRTPSAWAEIITAFTGAAGQQIVDSINGLSAEGKTTILAISPILAMIYFLSQQAGGGTGEEPPTEPDSFSLSTQPHNTFIIGALTSTTNYVNLVVNGGTITGKSYSCTTLDEKISSLQQSMDALDTTGIDLNHDFVPNATQGTIVFVGSSNLKTSIAASWWNKQAQLQYYLSGKQNESPC